MTKYIVTKERILKGVRYALEISIQNEKVVDILMKDVVMEIETILEDDCDEVEE